MKKIISLLSGLALLLSANATLAMANYSPLYQYFTLVFFHQSEHETTIINLSVDGDFSHQVGSGDMQQTSEGIMSTADNATGNLNLSLNWFYTDANGKFCGAHAPLNLPLKIENNQIVLQANAQYIVNENITYSDESCRSGFKHFEVTIEGNPVNRYRIEAAGVRQ